MNLTIYFDNIVSGYWKEEPVLNGVSGYVKGPGLFHLAAPNGSGKSTLFEVFAGYVQMWSGSMEIGGEPFVSGDISSHFALMRSQPALVPGVTLADHFYLYGQRFGCDRKVLMGMADKLSLSEHIDKVPEVLSTGTLKKAWFVCNLASRRDIWCLDEPFDGVDVGSVSVMIEELMERSRNSLILITSHHLPKELSLTDTPFSFSAPFVLSVLKKVQE
ncbi:MAG: ATP-binding cassette domain-containing protein [Actinomycetaceae bacterium]|nr:ATP-binding cassette domain-containing protein [Actinomycetaceae bacterium]